MRSPTDFAPSRPRCSEPCSAPQPAPHMSRLLRTIGIASPNWFPTKLHDETNQFVVQSGSTDRLEWRAFASAWNAVAARSRRAEDVALALRSAWRTSPNPVPEDRYREDCLLFEFACSFVSAVECGAYSVYVVLAIRSPAHFRLTDDKDLQRISLKHLERTAKTAGQDFTEISAVAHAVGTDIGEIRDIRDFLSHRGQLPRRVFLTMGEPRGSTVPSAPKVSPAKWEYDAELSVERVDGWHQLLVKSVTRLTETAHALGKSLRPAST